MYEYAIEPGFDDPSPTVVETLISYAPTTNPDQAVPLGSVRRRTLDGRAHTHGARRFQWRFAALSWADVVTFVTHVWGSFETENAEVTVITRALDNDYLSYNAIAILPLEGQGYTRDFGGDVHDFTVDFFVVSGPN